MKRQEYNCDLKKQTTTKKQPEIDSAPLKTNCK